MFDNILAATGAVLAAIIAVAWPSLHARHQRRRFMRLIVRELQEVEPAPGALTNGGDWTQLLTREFIHRAIIEEPAGHLDFILSLDPTLVYRLRQLWAAFHRADADEWLLRLADVRHYDSLGDVSTNVKRWATSLGRPVPAELRSCIGSTDRAAQ